jgi:carbon monoxide dehydrogenase subunit G
VLRVTRTFSVNRSPGDVYDYLIDFTNTEHWDPGTIRTTRTDDGPLEVGARFHNVSEFRGSQTELDYELTLAEAGRHLIFTGHNKTVTSTDNLTFAPDGSSTSITYDARFDFHGLAALVAPFLRSSLEKLADRTVDQMKDVLNAPTAAGTP